MKQHIRFLILVWLVISILPGMRVVAEAQRGLSVNNVEVTTPEGDPILLYQESHALIIGISNYIGGWPVLPGVQQDVREVKTALEEHGFNVEVAMDLDKIGIEDAFNAFISRYGQAPDNRLVFYFAGHGHTVRMSYGEEIGYIVPVDAPNPNKDLPLFQSKAIDMQRIEYFAKRIQSKHALFLFDACFSGSLFALSRAIPDIITYKTAQPVRQFITSGSADETVPDESIFRAQFIRALQGEADSDMDGYLTGTELGEFLQSTVVNYSRNSQHPQYGKIRNPNLDKGDFVFHLRQQEEENVLSDMIPAPPEVTVSFDDIEAQLKWQAYLENMETTFSKLVSYEQLDVTPESKVAAWERFLQAFSNDHPFSTRDEELRDNAQERMRVLKEGGTLPTLPAPQAPLVTTAPLTPTATPTVAPHTPKTWLEPITGMEFVWIEGGCFNMGSPNGEAGRSSGEGPVHEVCLPGFWIGKYEVTQGQWQQIMGENPAYFNARQLGINTSDFPVEQVSWNDVQKFLQELNRKAGKGKYRLPSEAEWEYAARAGTATMYAFGDEIGQVGQYAWFRENSEDQTHPVGQLQSNPWGLYDMHGNVWEWCADPSHNNYDGAPSDGSVWVAGADKSVRILRGGSWGSHPWGMRSASRLRNKPDYKNNSVGFRVVRISGE